jgi:hypothetical protein
MRDVLKTNYCHVQYDPLNYIIWVQFIGDMSDDEYKEIWNQSISFIFDYGLEKIVIDQSQIGEVGLSARAWVVMKAYPRIKRDLSPDLAVSIISSSNNSRRAGMQYLVKAVQAFSGYIIQFHSNFDESKVWLNEVKGKK